MNIFSRALAQFFGDAPQDSKALDAAGSGYNIMPTWDNNKPAYFNQDFSTFVREGLRANPVILACMSTKAACQSQVQLVVKDADGKTMPRHPLQALLDKPNPYMTAFDFRSITSFMLDLAGRAYWRKIRNKAGLPIMLWPMRPDLVAPVGTPDQFITHYELKRPNSEQVMRLEPADVLEFKIYDPLDLYAGLSPLAAAACAADVDNSITDFVKKLFEQGGVPPGLITTKQRLDETQVTTIRRRWAERYSGWESWLQPAVLDSEATYQQMSMSFKDMGFGDIDGRNEARICQVFGVPPILIGSVIGLNRSTFSNTREAKTYLYQNTVIPNNERVRLELQSDLAGDYGGGLVLEFDYSQIPELQESETDKHTRANAAAQVGVITVDEYRKWIGLEERGDDVGKLTILEWKNSVTPAASPFGMTLPAANRANFDEVTGDAEQTKASYGYTLKAPQIRIVLDGKDITNLPVSNEPLDGKAADGPDDEAQRLESEREMQAAMLAYFDGQVKRIVDAL